MEIKKLHSFFIAPVSSTPLITFRILFGLIMAFSMLRFYANGWIEKLYLEPQFHFHYYGFDWVKVPGQYTYILFFVAFLSALGIALGAFYKASTIMFFLSFTYIELMDKTTYLNHYYFISLVAFLLIFMPANGRLSYDHIIRKSLTFDKIPRYYVLTLQALLATVYIYAGLAKLNSDWMIEGKPLSIWLSSRTSIPIIGQWMDEKWLHLLFSWGGAIYDLSIVFLLINRKTRVFGFILVVLFHLLTGILFPIGMFPYIMIAATLIFFSPDWHDTITTQLRLLFNIKKIAYRPQLYPVKLSYQALFSVFLSVQLLLPLRYLTYDGNIFWNEDGYRFSWRVMLMEKTGNTEFIITDTLNRSQFMVQNQDFLSPLQIKQMNTQPDCILEYAHYLADHFKSQGHTNLAVYAQSFVSLNGRMTRRFLPENLNLLTVERSQLNNHWILPLDD